MDPNIEMPPPKPFLSESIRRKSSLSDKLNKLTSNPFNRRRTSATLTASESSTSLHRRSRIPTPSLGSRTSSLFGGLGSSNADDSDTTGTPKNKQRESQDGGSLLSSRRHSRLASGSTSSFFGNNNTETLYPKEFLENAKARTAWKENESQSSLPIGSSQATRLTPGSLHTMDEGLEIPGPDVSKCSEIATSPSATKCHAEESRQSTPVTTRNSRSISARLAKGPFFRLHSARHSLSTVPQTSSPRPKDRDSNVVIEERRLMAPINPPLTRSTTMSVEVNTSLAHTPYQFSPRTPNFMRPTSSSAARTSGSLKSLKSPPTPLNLPGCLKGDMLGFGFHRKNLVEAREKSQDTPSELPSEIGRTPGARLGAIPERAPPACETPTEITTKLRRKASTPFRKPIPTCVEQMHVNMRNSQGDDIIPQKYARGHRYASSPDIRENFETNTRQMPPLPWRFTASTVETMTVEVHEQAAALAAFEREHHSVEQSNEQISYLVADIPFDSAGHGRRSPIMRSRSGVFRRPSTVIPHQGLQQCEGNDPVSIMPMKCSVGSGLSNGNGNSSSYTRQATASRIPRSSSRPAGLHAAHDFQKPFRKTQHTTPLRHGNDKPSGQAIATFTSSPAEANLAVPTKSTANGEDEEGDITLVREEQDLRYWAGRFTAIDDHICNDAISSRDALWAHNVTLRHNHVLQLLHEKCRTRAAQESLTAFMQAWSEGWSGGVRGVYRDGVVLPPRNFMLEEQQRKKGGLMGKVFGRKKSKD
ncbi:MAG: hypothetical protein Q9210_000380 [Variospora velana]